MIKVPTLQRNDSVSLSLPPVQVMLAMMAVYFIWGSTYLVISFAIETIPALMMSGFRFGLAGLILFSFLVLRGETLPTRRQWRNTLLLGALMMGMGQGGVAFAVQWVSTGVAALAVAALPLWSVLIASLIERAPTRLEGVGLALGFTGVIVLNLGGELWAEPIGAIVLIIGPVSWSLGSILNRHLDLPGSMMTTACMLLCASVVMLTMSQLNGEQITELPSLKSVVSLLYLSLIGSVVAFSAYIYLLRNTSPAAATSYAYVNPMIAVVLGWLVADENLTIMTLISAAFIIGAVMMINFSSARQRKDVV